LLAYVAIGLFKHLVEGVLRDPGSLNKPSTLPLAEGLRIGGIAGSDVHWGRALGVAACVALGLWLAATPSGFSVRVVGGNPRAAQLVGLPATRLILLACAAGGACAGLAGAVEVAAVHASANASLIAGYGYAGILVAFIARQNPLAVVPVAILFGGFGAAGSLLQRRLGLPDASVLVLQGIAFVLILASEALRDLDWKALAARLRTPAGPTGAQAGMGDKLA
jgi:simple sugar transport system permease protein